MNINTNLLQGHFLTYPKLYKPLIRIRSMKMNVKNELMKMEKIHNVVCRNDGTLEIYSKGDVKDEVFTFLNIKCLNDCFTKVDFHNMENWK